MIKLQHLSVGILLLSAIIGLNSCTKTGATGATGATGTANVMYSNWANLRMTYNGDDSAYEQTIAADSITQAVLDSGLVLCYIKYTNSSGATQVESASTYMEDVLALNSIQLYSYVYDFTGVPFRYIIIHGGTNVGSRLSSTASLIQGHTAAEWKAMTYDQVIAALKE
ncbi:MAG: hypothetical protein QM726_15595 [Chitinophagaceae bacterium]